MRIPGARAFASLSRRIRTLVVATVVFVTLLVLAVTLPVPYVILSPGPTFNTLGKDDSGNVIITIKGTQTKATRGHLNMTTVNVSTQPVSVFAAITGWLEHDEVVVPRSTVFPPGQSEEQVNKQNTQDFTQSQDNAVAAASCELGYPVKFGVLGVLSSGAAFGILQPSDAILTLDGRSADTADELTGLLEKDSPGTKITLGIERQGRPLTEPITLGPPPKGRGGASIGINVGTVCQMPFSVDLGLGNQIGGPSAGLMFALGIMDKVGKLDLTGGRFIAGTGTIDTNGTVGPIGGIQLKMIAARRAGATIFLAPVGNCPDVNGAIPAGLQVVKVATLHNAVQDLEAIDAGRATSHC